MKGLLVALGFSVAFFSCKGKKDPNLSSSRSQPTLTVASTSDSSVFISPFAWFSFRRSYADIQSMDDEKEIDRYTEEQDRANPWLTWGHYDTTLLPVLEKFKLVKDKELLEHSFGERKDGYFEIDDVSGRKLHISFKAAYPIASKTKTISRDSCQILYYSTNEISYAIKDILTGGNPEIVVVDKYYFMNGYIFDLTIYEICYK